MPTYKIRNIPVEFPFNAYDCQLVYMEKVIQSLQEKKNALLESPTGTGKTLCLVCSTLAWRESYIKEEIERLSLQLERGELEFSPEELSLSSATPSQLIYRKVIREAPKIIYASRTHSQLSQVMDELKNCPYNPKASVLGSRKQLCINPSVTNKPATAQGVHCRKLVSQHKCRFAHKVQDFKNHHAFTDEPLAIEELAKLGKKYNVCPYYISKEMQLQAEIILLPYNYLIDPISRKSLNIDLKGSILIFDEAHNLESVCLESASFQLPSTSILKCLDHIKTIIQMANAASAFLEPYDISKDTLKLFKDIFEKLYNNIMNSPISKDGMIKPGEYILNIFSNAGVTEENISLVTEALDVLTSIVSDELGAYVYPFEQFGSAILLVYENSLGDTLSKNYKVYINEYFIEKQMYGRQKEKVRSLNFWCFNSGVAMKPLNLSGIRSFILTSGTLSPLDSFAFELQTDFPIQLENPHVIDQSQIWIGVTCCGPTGNSLNTSYKTRSNEKYIQELGNAIVNFCRIVPSGLLVFFSSYTIMEKYIESWKKQIGDKTPIWDRITLYKKPVSEPRDGSILNDTIEDFYKKVNDPNEKGAVFFAVCRGKVSEGLDFANDNGRAVVITGIPFPSMADQRVKLKQQYLDNTCKIETKVKTITGNEWYKQQASRAVNQAVGRVIRHRGDYGAIILCDERFSYTQNRNQLSSWLRPHIKTYNKFGDVSLGLTRFFKYASANFTVPNKIKKDEYSASCSSSQVNISKTIIKRKKFVPPRRKTNTDNDNTPNITGKKRSRLEYNTQQKLESSFNKLNSSLETKTTDKSLLQTEQKRKKAKTAIEFIQEAKETLSTEEYKEFQSLLRKYKQKNIKIEHLVDKVQILFACNDKKHLLKGFATFIPKKYKETYSNMLISVFSEEKEDNNIKKTINTQSIIKKETIKSINNKQNNDIIKIDIEEIQNDINTSPLQNNSQPETNTDIPFEESESINIETTIQIKNQTKTYDLITGKPIKKKKRPSNHTLSDPLIKDKKLINNNNKSTNIQEKTKEENDDLLKASNGIQINCTICKCTAESPFSSRCGHICCKSCWSRWLKEQLTCPVCRKRVREKQLTKLYFT